MGELKISKYFIREKATFEAMRDAGELEEGIEYWIKETGEIYVFDGKFGGDLSKKQDTLKSGENIKTVNGESLLGEGDIEIKGGGDVSVDDIEVFIPLSRDFSDDFNNDFAR